MRLLFYAILIAFVAILNSASGRDLSMDQFEQLPSEEALKLYMSSNENPSYQKEMLRSALRQRKIELSALFFQNYSSLDDFIETVNEILDSEFKNEVVVMMLRTESGFWPIDPPIENGSRGVIYENAREPFVGTISKYFPALPINEELFSKRSNRLKLAAELESAMARENIKNRPQTERPKKRIPPAIPDASISENRSPDSKLYEQSKYSNLSAQPKKRSLMWGVIFLFGLGIGCFFAKKFVFGARRN